MNYNMSDYRTSEANASEDGNDGCGTRYGNGAHGSQVARLEQGQNSDLAQKLLYGINSCQVYAGWQNKSNKHEGANVSIEDEGLIANASLEKGWQGRDVENSAFRRLTTFHPHGDESTSISLHQSEIPVNNAAAQAFHFLLQKYADEEYKLNGKEIASLESVLNRLNAGDNQFTNSAQAGDRYAPIFHIDNCCIQQINERAVLVVEGNFVKDDGSSGAALKGVLLDRDGTGEKIQGLAFEASDTINFQKHEATFNNMLKSIKWTVK